MAETVTEVRDMTKNQNKDKKIDEKETDDLIAKIEEAIKGENELEITSITPTDIAKSSDTDFIKKLEEIENEELKVKNKQIDESAKAEVLNLKTNNEEKVKAENSEKVSSKNNGSKSNNVASDRKIDVEKEIVNTNEKKNLNNEKNIPQNLLITQKIVDTVKVDESPTKSKEQLNEIHIKESEKKDIKNGTIELNEKLIKNDLQKTATVKDNITIELDLTTKKKIEKEIPETNAGSELTNPTAINDLEKMSVDENSDDKMDVDLIDNPLKMEIDESKSPTDTKVVDVDMDENKKESNNSESLTENNEVTVVTQDKSEKNVLNIKKAIESKKDSLKPLITNQNETITNVKEVDVSTTLNATPVTLKQIISETSTVTGTSSSTDSSDNMNKYTEKIKNGMADTTTDEDTNLKLSSDITLEEERKEINEKICYEVKYILNKTEFDLLSVLKIEDMNTSLSSIESDLSTSDEVTSLSQFNLPQSRLSELSTISNSTDYTNKITKKHFKNAKELMAFLNKHFTIITDSLHEINVKSINTNTKKTRKNTANTANNSIIEDIEPETEEIKQSNSSKKIKLDDDKECVFAKWADKKYYAGKIIEKLVGNKYKILYEDGATKVLPQESIVFAENGIIPLKDHPVYASINDDYQLGKVLSATVKDFETVYEVEVDNNLYKLKPSDLYLTIEQARIIQKLVNNEKSVLNISGRATRKRSMPPSPKAGSSGMNPSRKKTRLPPPIFQRTHSESSDISDGHDGKADKCNAIDMNESNVEPEGVQPELQRSEKESEVSKMMSIDDYKCTHDPYFNKSSLDNLLGPFPQKKKLFKSKHFLLTCTTGLKPHCYEISHVNDRNRQFSSTPFIKSFLQKQIEAGGGVVYRKFDEVSKSKYKQTKLIASRPCLTSKYIQCLAADIQAVSHEWVIDCCRQNKLLHFSQYYLPSGWSITRNRFINWSIGKSINIRESKQPLSRKVVFIASNNTDFIDFWGQICKLSGAKVNIVKSLDDITNAKGVMLIESDLSQNMRDKAISFGITMVSPLFLHECLIVGNYCDPNENSQFTRNYQDEY